jgi:hypothetical protein
LLRETGLDCWLLFVRETGLHPDLRVEPGHLVHIDLGVKHDGFCSDLQRMWYVRRPGETAPPETVRRAIAAMPRDQARALLAEHGLLTEDLVEALAGVTGPLAEPPACRTGRRKEGG